MQALGLNHAGIYLYTSLDSFAALAVSFARDVLPPTWVQSIVSNDNADRLLKQSVCTWNENGVERTRFYLDVFAKDYGDHCATTDWVVLFCLFAFMFTFNWGMRFLVLEPFFRNHHHTKSPNQNLRAMQKFSENATAFLVHTASAYFAFRIITKQAWLYDQREWFRSKDAISLDASFKFYYLFYAARYICDAVSLFFEQNRSGKLAYAIHHIVTVGVVILSALLNYTNSGGILMFFFDWAEPFELAGKVCKYLSRNTTDIYRHASDFFFKGFTFAFLATHNVIYTYVVYAAATSHDEKNDAWWVRPVFGCLLLIFLLLNTFWLGEVLEIQASRQIEVFSKAFISTHNIIFAYVVYASCIGDEESRMELGGCFVLGGFLVAFLLLNLYWLGQVVMSMKGSALFTMNASTAQVFELEKKAMQKI